MNKMKQKDIFCNPLWTRIHCLWVEGVYIFQVGGGNSILDDLVEGGGGGTGNHQKATFFILFGYLFDIKKLLIFPIKSLI